MAVSSISKTLNKSIGKTELQAIQATFSLRDAVTPYSPSDRVQVRRICRRLLGRSPEAVERLGGASRTVWRVTFDSETSAIVVYRDNDDRARVERFVLSRLAGKGAPVPQVLAGNGGWLIQSDLGADRLPLLNGGAIACDTFEIYATALDSLVSVHQSGAGLATSLRKIGGRKGWLDNLVFAPNRIGALAGISAPQLDIGEISTVLQKHRSQFIKWDARMGNAALTAGGRVGWFDFEHCGCRDPLDDLAWFLGDENFQDSDDQDIRLIDDFINVFADGLPEVFARQYLTIMGTLHMCIRIGLILDRKGDGPWWSNDACRDLDLIGVTEWHFSNLVSRIGRWVEDDRSLSPLKGWLDEIRLKVLDGSNDAMISKPEVSILNAWPEREPVRR